MSIEPLVLRTQAGAVVRLTLNRPAQFNALSEAMLRELIAQFEQIALEPEVRVVVLAAAGKAFCPGHDLREMLAEPALDYYQRLFSLCTRMMLTMQRLPQPVIARVHGVATAAGCQLVAMADLAIAAEDARFAVSGINLGLFCATPAVALSRAVGRKSAFKMLVTGDFIDAKQALADGLVNEVVPLSDLDESVERLAAQVCSKAAVAIRAGKGLFYQQLDLGIEAAYQLAGQTMACNMMDPSAQAGVKNFLEKSK